jgi:hypothetical protein
MLPGGPPPLDDSLDPARIEQPAAPCLAATWRGSLAPEQGAHQADHLARARQRHLIDPEARPGVGQKVGPPARLVCVGGEHARVDGTDGRAAQNIDWHLAAERAWQLAQEALDDPDLVRASRGPPPREPRQRDRPWIEM